MNPVSFSPIIVSRFRLALTSLTAIAVLAGAMPCITAAPPETVRYERRTFYPSPSAEWTSHQGNLNGSSFRWRHKHGCGLVHRRCHGELKFVDDL